jgi:hypothetical protein|tara:strand:- start:3165 stop:3446 length:282 start_codon:yes stop_codon:yes gene_type:complete
VPLVLRAQQVLQALQVRPALTVLTEPPRLFPLEQSLQAQLVQAQLLLTAAAVLLQRLTFLFPGVQQAQQVPLVLKGLLVRTELMVRMEAQTLF